MESYLEDTLLDEIIHNYLNIVSLDHEMQNLVFGTWLLEIHCMKKEAAQQLQRMQQIGVRNELFHCQTLHVLVFELCLLIEILLMSTIK